MLRMNRCLRSNYPPWRSLTLSFLSFLLLSMQFAQNSSAQTLLPKLKSVALAQDQVSGIDKLKFVAQENIAAQNPQEVTTLELGKPVERDLSGGQKHAYQITLAEGQYVSLIVEQRGIDVVVRLFSPDGKLITDCDSVDERRGREDPELVAEAAGNYKFEVVAKRKDAPAGRYEIKITELRAATPRQTVCCYRRASLTGRE